MENLQLPCYEVEKTSYAMVHNSEGFKLRSGEIKLANIRLLKAIYWQIINKMFGALKQSL